MLVPFRRLSKTRFHSVDTRLRDRYRTKNDHESHIQCYARRNYNAEFIVSAFQISEIHWGKHMQADVKMA